MGLHIKKNCKLPSGESVKVLFEKCKNENWLGIIAACVSPEIISKSTEEFKQLGIPFGYKANLWEISDPLPHTAWNSNPGTNPNKIMGTREDYTDVMFSKFSERMLNKGATILGGCCEIKPSHIKQISKLK